MTTRDEEMNDLRDQLQALREDRARLTAALTKLLGEKRVKADDYERLAKKLELEDRQYAMAEQCATRAYTHREWIADLEAILAALSGVDPVREERKESDQ